MHLLDNEGESELLIIAVNGSKSMEFKIFEADDEGFPNEQNSYLNMQSDSG